MNARKIKDNTESGLEISEKRSNINTKRCNKNRKCFERNQVLRDFCMVIELTCSKTRETMSH
jgi:hypothetical protein